MGRQSLLPYARLLLLFISNHLLSIWRLAVACHTFFFFVFSSRENTEFLQLACRLLLPILASASVRAFRRLRRRWLSSARTSKDDITKSEECSCLDETDQQDTTEDLLEREES